MASLGNYVHLYVGVRCGFDYNCARPIRRVCHLKNVEVVDISSLFPFTFKS